MKQGQFDIFAEGAGPLAEPEGEAPKKPRRRRKPREAKKAPMLVDAYQPTIDPRGGKKKKQDCHSERSEESPVRKEILRSAQDDSRQADARVVPVVAAGPRIFSVSEITERIKGRLEGEFTDLWLEGELTDFRNRTGRHLYFALKDETSRIRAIIFGAEGMRLPFELADGLEVVVHGRINVYAPQGSYSIIIDAIEPKGIGALQLAFEQLKKKLEAEGLFESSRKRPLPYLPRRIGVVTSPTGAAIRDIVHVLTRRFPAIEVVLHPVRVQGEGAAPEIAEAIARMNTLGGCDLLIVGRGGGSIEDLWAFNEEVVARAIAASALPVISAVGHEIDFTIADFVADVRAATPSAAAEIAVPVKADLAASIADRRRKLAFALQQLLVTRGHELARLAGRLPDPRKQIPDLMLRVDELRRRLTFALQVGMERRGHEIARLLGGLHHLSPLGVLAKGYAMVRAGDGRIVTEAKSLKMGEEVGIRLHRGEARAKVTKIIDN